MPRLDSLLISTDFDTLKNDGEAVALVVVPSSDVVPAGTTKTYETTVDVGEAASIIVASVNNNVTYPSGEYLSLSSPMRFDRTGGGGTAYSIVIRITHTGGSSIKCIASIFHQGASPLTLSSTTDSFTFRIRTIKVPRFE